MKIKQALEKMFDEQRELLKKYREDVENYETKNIKALLHELVEYEQGFAWKPWKDGVDARLKEHVDVVPETEKPNRPLTESEAEDYRKEEVVDMWHFLIQEAIENPKTSMQTLLDGIKGYKPTGMIHNSLRLAAADYKRAQYLENESRGKVFLEDLARCLWEITMNEFEDANELYNWYVEKNEENDKRRKGESEGRIGYDFSNPMDEITIDDVELSDNEAFKHVDLEEDASFTDEDVDIDLGIEFEVELSEGGEEIL